MSNLKQRTKQELIEEVEALQRGYAPRANDPPAPKSDGNGSFDEDELFARAGGKGDELFLATETGKFVFINDTMLRKLGYSLDEMKKMTVPRIDPKHTRAHWLKLVSTMKETDEPADYETEFIGSDGTAHPRHIRARYVSLRGKRYVLCTAESIQEEVVVVVEAPVEIRKKTSIKRETIIASTVSDGIIIVDTRGVITETNSAVDRMFGLPKHEVIGMSCVDSKWRLIDHLGNTLTISDHPMMAALVEEQPINNSRIGMQLSNGNSRYLLVNAAPLYDEEGNLTGSVGSFRYSDSDEKSSRPAKSYGNEETHGSSGNFGNSGNAGNYGNGTMHGKTGSMLRETVALVLAAHSEHELERNICRMLVGNGNYQLAWRGVTQKNNPRVTASVVEGPARDFMMKTKVRCDDSEYGNGPIGQALKTHEPMVVSDTEEATDYEPWRVQSVQMNLLSLAAFPLEFDGNNYGVLTLYSKESGHFVDPVYSILKEIADTFAFGLASLHHRKTLSALSAQNKQQEFLFTALSKQLPAAIALFGARAPYVCNFANRQFNELLDEPFHSTGINGLQLADFTHACYNRDLMIQLDTAASGNEDIIVDGVVLSDWQGNESSWNWRVLPLNADDVAEQLLVIAWKKNSDPVGNKAVRPALLCLDYPKPAPRTRKEKRIEQFFSDSRMVSFHTDNGETIAATEGSPLASLVKRNSSLGLALAESLTEKEIDGSIILNTPTTENQSTTATNGSAGMLFTRALDKTTMRAWIILEQPFEKHLA